MTCKTSQSDNHLPTSPNKMLKGKNYLNEMQKGHDQLDEFKNNLFDHEFLNKKLTQCTQFAIFNTSIPLNTS